MQDAPDPPAGDLTRAPKVLRDVAHPVTVSRSMSTTRRRFRPNPSAAQDRFTRELGGFGALTAVHRQLEMIEGPWRLFVELCMAALDAPDGAPARRPHQP